MVSNRSARRAASVGLLLPALLAAASFGTPALSAQADSARRDSTRTVRLSPLSVTVTRTVEPRSRVPASVGIVDTAALWRAQLLGGIDEALGRIPGVVAQNRFNPSLDERLIIRGSGARGNFGVRGIKILIDGLPQTLPDGQSQLTNLDLGTIGRVEALLGSSSALYGNAAAGVLSFSTIDPTPDWSGRIRITGGSFGTSRVSGMTAGTMGQWRGFIAATQLRSDGFRQHSQSTARQVSVGLDRVLSAAWLLKIRYFLASDPTAQNPGALTAAEAAANPDSAAAANVLRGANKAVTQHQAGVTLAHADARGNRFEATVFGLARNLDNPLATAPPGAPGPTVGTFSTIDRLVGGARVLGSWRLDPRARLTLGGDAQIMRDDRMNRRSNGGAASDTVVADQRETVSELAPFAALHWEPARSVTVTSALRYDRVRFRVQDHYLDDGIDQSGAKTMGAVSGSVGSSVAASSRLVVYGNLASAFETPTTTELVNQSNGQIGFNTDLGPQRTLTVEVGARTTGPLEASLALYRARVTDPLVQVREQDGRAFFANAGRIRVQGVEAGLRGRPAGWLRLEGSYAYTDATYREYHVQNGATVDSLDGNRVPGVPDHVFRAVVGLSGRAVSLEVEQQIVSSLFADDRNAIAVRGWGAGVTGVRVAASFALGRIRIGPFGAVQNLFDRRSIATVTVNGFGGRVFEPAPGRWAWIGAELAW